MNIKAFTWSVDRDTDLFISNLFQSIFGDKISLEILDLNSRSTTTRGSDFLNATCFAFGTRALNIINDEQPALMVHALPLAKDLVKNQGNEQRRQQVWNQLKNIKQQTKQASVDNASRGLTQVTVYKADVATTNEAKLDRLKKELESKGVDRWEGKTVSGRTLCISLHPNPKSNAELIFTFDEMFAMKLVMDIFGVENLTVVPGEKK